MKMDYFSKNNKKSNRKRTFLFGVLALSLVVSFYFGWLSFLKEPLQLAGRPLWQLKSYSLETASQLISFFQTKKSLWEENERLKNELSEINSRLLSWNLLSRENYELKKMLGNPTEDPTFILANILAKPNLSPYDTLILDVGEATGIRKGDKVMVGKSLLGEVAVVYSQTSQVRLYSFPGELLEVAVGFDKIVGTAKGKGSCNFEIKFPRDVFFEKGDLVFLPEMDLAIIGVVEEILSTPEDPWQTLLFRLPVNIFELKWVQILQEE